jgi:ribose transport system substrate-binding protein
VKDRGIIALIALALVAALAVSLAYRRDSGPSRPKEKVVAIFKVSSSSNAFWAAVNDGVESGAKDFGFDVSIRWPRDEIYVDEQIAIMRTAIAERPAAIVLAAGDFHRLVDPVREAEAQGIKVVCVDSFIESEDADAKIGTDNFEAGQKCAAALLRQLAQASRSAAQALPAAAPRVAVMSYVQGSSTAIGRESGLRSALVGKARIVGTSYSSSDTELAYRQAKAFLATDPPLDGIAALNLNTAVGAARALAESGKAGKVTLVGFDNSYEMMRFIERGIIKDTIVQKPFNMGYLSMATVRDLLSGKHPKRNVNTGSVDINKANMFEPENQKLLFPVSGN